jgi:hypothetical protein
VTSAVERRRWTGGCRCGAVRYVATGEPAFVANCHCRECRGQTGAAYATWIGFRAEQVRHEADPPRIWEAAGGVKRGFCPTCGTPISFAADRWAGEIHLLVGTLDDPSAAAPGADVFMVDALSWVALDDALPHHERVPG